MPSVLAEALWEGRDPCAEKGRGLGGRRKELIGGRVKESRKEREKNREKAFLNSVSLFCWNLVICVKNCVVV